MAKKKSVKTTNRQARKKAPAKRKSAKKPSLGRPTTSADEKLFMVFHDDFHSRQVFEFLRAETLGDLERYSPQEIIRRLTRPIRETVDRIRTRLADLNRSLAEDEKFAFEYKRQKKG
jgi:hypothetical protein